MIEIQCRKVSELSVDLTNHLTLVNTNIQTYTDEMSTRIDTYTNEINSLVTTFQTDATEKYTLFTDNITTEFNEFNTKFSSEFEAFQQTTTDNINQLKTDILKLTAKIITDNKLFIHSPIDEVGLVKTNNITLDSVVIRLGDLTYSLPSTFTNTFTEVGTDVLVLAELVDEEITIKLVDHTNIEYVELENEMILGGYHIGANRTYTNKGVCDDDASIYIGIVEDSFWTQYFRPESDPRGMVYIGNGTWWDIYLNSMEWIDDQPNLVSKHNKIVATGDIDTIQYNDVCNDGLCWLDASELFTNINKTFPDSTDYYRICSSQPSLILTDVLDVYNSGTQYVNSDNICTSVNNYGITDLINSIGFFGGKTDAFGLASGKWSNTLVDHFLEGRRQHTVLGYNGVWNVQQLGRGFTTDPATVTIPTELPFTLENSSASISINLTNALFTRDPNLGCRGTSTTKN